MKVKFPTKNRIGELFRDQSVVCNRYVHTLKVKKSFPIKDSGNWDEEKHKTIQPFEEILLLPLDEKEESKVTYVGVEDK